MSAPATAQFGPTADELFERSGVKSDGARATASSSETYAVLRGPGSIVSGPTAQIAIDILRDTPTDVFIAGRVYSVNDQGQREQVGKAFYAPKNFSLTKYGPGYFPKLYAGGVIPVGDVPTGNAGDQTTVEVTIFSGQGGPLQTLTTSFSNRVRLVTEGCTTIRFGLSNCPMKITSASVMADGDSMRVEGNFPLNQPLTVEVGDPEWDAGFLSASSSDGKTLQFKLPAGKGGNRLYPGGWPAQANWSLVVATREGVAVTATRIIRVEGNDKNQKIAESQ